MRLELLSLVAALAPSFVFADVQFTSPAAGASIPAGAITVQWTESGDAPSISQLSSYTLTLMVGGQTDDTAVCNPRRKRGHGIMRGWDGEGFN
jgi:hypothetical protein